MICLSLDPYALVWHFFDVSWLLQKGMNAISLTDRVWQMDSLPGWFSLHITGVFHMITSHLITFFELIFLKPLQLPWFWHLICLMVLVVSLSGSHISVWEWQGLPDPFWNVCVAYRQDIYDVMSIEFNIQAVVSKTSFLFWWQKVISIGICYFVGMWSQRNWYVTPIGD